MTKVVVRLPEPKKEYSEDNQRQINRALTAIIEQLNSTYLTQQKEDQERFTWLGTWFNGKIYIENQKLSLTSTADTVFVYCAF
jgi:hypothetical protein